MTPREGGGLGEYLRGEGAPDRVVQGGLDVLLDGWERTVAAVEEGYARGYEEYLNDLDGRQLLAQALAHVTPSQAAAVEERLTLLDSRIRAATTPVTRCLWGAIVAEEEGWDPEANWWYYARPLQGPAEFLKEFPAA
jgi:hypothetical protein